jgi:hypothetical protein
MPDPIDPSVVELEPFIVRDARTIADPPLYVASTCCAATGRQSRPGMSSASGCEERPGFLELPERDDRVSWLE